MVLNNFITIVCCALLVCVSSAIIYQAVSFTNGTTIINRTLPSGNVVIDGSLTVLGPVSIEPPETLDLTSITKDGTTMNWPPGDGLPGSVLTTDGAGNLSFQTFPGGGNVTADPVFSAQNKLVRTNFALGSTTIQESNITVGNDTLSGLTSVTSTTFNGNLNGNATSATSFSGVLSGDVVGPQSATEVKQVGTVSKIQIQTGVLDALFATNANTPDLIVKRDGSGGFSAGTIVGQNPTGFVGNLFGNVNGTASNAVNATNATNFTAPLVGDVIGFQSLTEVKTVGGKTAVNVSNAVDIVNDATHNSTPNTLVLRDLNGNFSSQTITANTGFIGNLTGNASTATFATTAGSASSATTFTDPLAGDVTGTQLLTVVSTVGGKTASAIASTVDTVNAASSLSVPSTLVLRDASSNFQINEIVSNRITVNGTVSNATDAATKQYVDNAVVAGVLVPKASVNALASTVIVLSGLQTIDSVPLIAGDRVLITNQGNNSGLPNINNGIWIVAAGPWTRSADLPAGLPAQQAYVLVQNGPVPNVYGGSSWICNTPAAIVGTNPVGFVEFSVADSVTAVNVGSGVGLFKNKTANDLNFKTLLPTGHIQIVPDTDEVRISTDGVSTNTPNTLVVRDGFGNFAANQITASLVGSASLNVLKTGDTMSGSLTMDNNAQLRLLDTGTSFYVGLKAPGSMAANYAFSLPPNAPNSGQVLVATSASTTQWATPGGGFLAKPRTIFVSKAGSNVTGQGTALSPYLTVAFALTQALAASPSVLQPIVILIGAGVFTEANPMVISEPGITLLGVSLTGTWIVPSDLTSDLFQITTPSFEFANMTLSTLGGSSTAAAINVNTTAFGNSGIRTTFITGFQTGVNLASTSSSNVPITIFAQFNCVGNQTSLIINDNVRAVIVDALILGAFPGSSTPVYVGVYCVGSNSLVTIQSLSLRSLAQGLICDGGVRVKMTGGAIVDNCYEGYRIQGAASMDCAASNFTNNTISSVNIVVTDANTTATFVGCLINGSPTPTPLGQGVVVASQAQVSITGSTISNCDVGIICGTSTDTNTTKLICSSVSLKNCNQEIVQEGSSTFVFDSGQFEPNLTFFDDTTNVTINAFDQSTNGTLTIGNSSDVDSTIYKLFTNSVSLPKLEYKADLYGLKGPIYQDFLNGCVWGTYSQPADAFLYSVVGNNTKVAGIRLISDTNDLGDNDDTRGWIIQKDGTNANLSFYYENNDSSGLSLRGLNRYFQYDGQRNALSFVNTSVAPAPDLPYTKLIWGLEADNVNLYRGSLSGFLQTDSKFTVTSLTANRAVVTDGTSTLSSSATTATEIGYVNGVTSSIQAQLDSKLPTSGGTLIGPLTLPVGSVSNLSLRFSSGFLTTGLFSDAGKLNFVTGGSNRLIIDQSSPGQITMSSLAGTSGVVHASATGVLSNSLIVDADITNNTITDSKLQTISTAGKVANSATTATSANTINTIVLRDGSGNFSAGTITANNGFIGNLTGNASTATFAATAGSVSTTVNRLNFAVEGVTVEQQQLVYDQPTVIKTSNITARLDNPSNIQQVYTFGQSVANRWVAVGSGTTNSIAYSSDGITWTGLGKPIFSTQGYAVAWNGTRWVAVGQGSNSIAYSSDGITWTGVTGTSIFSFAGYDVAWNGVRWVSVGLGGTNSIAYSSDGITWIGLGKTIFSNQGNGVAWNGSRWVAVGEGTNSIAYSSDGINWTGIGTSIFSGAGYGVAWNGIRWVAVGDVGNTIAYSSDGITWTGIGASIFSVAGYGVSWNGIRWVAVGQGTNSIAYSSDGITWTGLSTSTFSIAGNDVAWNGTRWVAVGQGTNSIAYSSDGITWTGIGTGIFSSIGYGVAWNGMRQNTIVFPGNQTVALGSGTNTIAYSGDGITWTGIGASIFSSNGNGVAWNGTRWVAVGQGGNSIAYSSNGITWTGLATSIFSNNGNAVAWNGTRWVALGNGTNTIAYSSDGITWTGLGTSIFSTAGRGLAWNGTIWVAVGVGTTNSIAYSSDGITWTGLGNSIFTSGLGVAWNGTRWVAVGNGTNTIAYSSDGINWTGLSTSIFSTNGNGVAWNGTQWVAVGDGTNSIAYSSNGINWTGLATSIFSSGLGVTWNGTRWVAVGSGTNSIAYSSNGINWTGIATGSSVFTTSGRAVAWNAGLGSVNIQQPTVAVGQGTNSIAYSIDGITWTGLGSSIFTNSGRGVAWNGTRWVAVGQGTNTIAYSTDGITWTGIGSSIFSIGSYGLAWNGTRWVAVGNGGNTIAYSSDGIVWTGIGVSTFSSVGRGVAWNGTRWVAVGNGVNSIAYSSDGITWTGLLSTIFTNVGNGVAWNGTRWVAVGEGANSIAYSSDGITWTGIGTSIFSTAGYGIAWNGTRFVAVGQGGNSIAYSSDGITWTGLATSIFTSIGNGVAWNGTRFVAVGQGGNSIAYSSDGITWTGIATSIFTSIGYGVAGNPNVGATIVDSQLVLNANGFGLNSTLDVCSDNYYNNGYTNFSVKITSQNL